MNWDSIAAEVLSKLPVVARHKLASKPPSPKRRGLINPLEATHLTQQQLWHTTNEIPNALLLVAHPDDELLFACGLLLAYPHWNWHIFCMTAPSGERDKRRDASSWMLYNNGVNVACAGSLGLEDVYPHEPALWTHAVDSVFAEKDIVFTHGARGEYGNLHHIALNHIAHALFHNVWDFHSPCTWKREPQLLKSRVNVIPTDGRKRILFGDAYPEEWDSLWSADPNLMRQQLSGNPEYFTSDVEPESGEAWPEWRWA